MKRKTNVVTNIVLSTLAIALAQTLPVTTNAAIGADRLFGQVTTSPLVVHVAGSDAFSINVPAGGFSALERTLIVERNINNALKATLDTTPNAVQVIHINNIPVVRLGGYHVVTADSASAQYAGTSMDDVAQAWANGIRQGLANQAHVTAYVAGLDGDFLPSSENAPYRRARLEAARLNHAAVAFRENVPTKLFSSDSVTLEGMKAMNARDPEAAQVLFAKAILMNKGNSRAHYGMGTSLLQQGKVDQSIESLQMARWLEPDYAMVHLALGQAFETQGESRDAVKQYQEAALLQQDNPEPVLLIADIREGRNDMGKSVRELSAAANRIPSSQYIILKQKDQTMWRLNRAL
jgi:tetratricopeptide (TPR) repeat protein